MSDVAATLICFAVKEEGRYFRPGAANQDGLMRLVTGMGHKNAERSLRAVLRRQKPALVLSCGFAGGLKPELKSGQVVFCAEKGSSLESLLQSSGAIPATFHCMDRVAVTAAEKLGLRNTTGADVVEMESGVLCRICREERIPNASVRVILDTVEQDLPLDFNALMTARQTMHFGKLAWQLLIRPGKVAGLLRLQKQVKAAGRSLGRVLEHVTGALPRAE